MDGNLKNKEVEMALIDRLEERPVVIEDPFKLVEIRKVANGFIVKVGCRTLVAYTWEEVNTGLLLYYTNPEEAEKKYCK